MHCGLLREQQSYCGAVLVVLASGDPALGAKGSACCATSRRSSGCYGLLTVRELLSPQRAMREKQRKPESFTLWRSSTTYEGE